MISEQARVCVSIVSHGQGQMVEEVVASLLEYPEVARVIVTRNIPEDVDFADRPEVELIENDHPKGFGANHNSASQRCREPFFCVLNPDVQFGENPFPVLLEEMERERVALCAPAVYSVSGDVEDSVRRFPTFYSLLLKLSGMNDSAFRYDVDAHVQSFSPEWVGGMFMLFRADVFRQLKGFDEGFHLYYEDVDVCVRVWMAGYRIRVCPTARIVHQGQRASRRNLRYLRWHVLSLIRYFMKYRGRLPRVEE